MHLVSREISLWDHIFAWDKMAYVLIKEKKSLFLFKAAESEIKCFTRISFYERLVKLKQNT